MFLHPTQLKLAEGDRSGPVRVLGGAGTGKTVLAMHRAKWLAQSRTKDGQQVLFTTFTRNLAADIEHNLKSLCDPQTMARIKVQNLDAWVNGFMRALKLEHRIVYNRQQDAALQAWTSALAVRDTTLDLPERFYEQELEQVVLAQGITTLDEYRVARRTGRAGVLTRAKRDAVWPVFEEYRGQLASRNLKEFDDAYREIADILDKDPSCRPALSAIVIDETQDLGPQALKLLRAMIPPGTNDLFFVGDGHQRIYSRNRASMGKCWYRHPRPLTQALPQLPHNRRDPPAGRRPTRRLRDRRPRRRARRDTPLQIPVTRPDPRGRRGKGDGGSTRPSA